MTIVGFGIVIYKMVRHRAISMMRALSLQICTVVLACISLALSSTLLAIVAVVVGSTGIVPQVVRAARTNHLTGVSVATYVIIAVMSASWFVYGVMIEDAFVSAPNIIIVPSATFIAVRAIRSHRSQSRTIVAETLPAR